MTRDTSTILLSALVSTVVSLAVSVLVVDSRETPAPQCPVALPASPPRVFPAVPGAQAGPRRDALDAVHREVSAAVAAVEATAPADLETWSANWVVEALSASGSWGVRSRSTPAEARLDLLVETTDKEVVLRAGGREVVRVALAWVGNGRVREAVRDHLLAALKEKP